MAVHRGRVEDVTMLDLPSRDVPLEDSGDPFAAWMLDTFNRAGFCLMASVGHRCGLFDALRDLPW